MPDVLGRGPSTHSYIGTTLLHVVLDSSTLLLPVCHFSLLVGQSRHTPVMRSGQIMVSGYGVNLDKRRPKTRLEPLHIPP